MKKTFKKIMISAISVATLALGTVGMNVSAYGGTGSFNVNGVSVTKSIDAYKTSADASSECTPLSCSFVYVSLTCDNSSTGSKTDNFSATRGYVSVNLTPDSGKLFGEARSYHSARVNGVSGNSSMMVHV